MPWGKRLVVAIAIVIFCPSCALSLRRVVRYAQDVLKALASGSAIRKLLQSRSPHALLMTADDLYSRLCNEDHVSGRLIVIEVVPTGHVGAVPPIPGSQRVWRPDYQLPISSSQPLDGLAPTAESFEAFAQRLGVNEDSEVILISERYDDTRLWWLFVAFGKRSVYILDGGFTEWERRVAARPLASLEKTKGTVKHARGTWKAQPFNTQLLATRPSVSRLRTAAKPRLWDVRTKEEYEGSVILPGAARAGRIPWATRRVEWNMFRREDGTWLPPHEIRETARRELDASRDDREDQNFTHVFYCQSGVRTTQLIFGLSLAGWPLDRLKNYDGSWIEWSHVAHDDDILKEEL